MGAFVVAVNCSNFDRNPTRDENTKI